MLRRRPEPTSPAVDPVVIVSITRTGSTLLQRLLDVSPELTIWGEHFGVLSHVRHAVETLDRARDQLAEGYAQRTNVIGPFVEPRQFSPQVNTFDTDQFVANCRQFVLDLFTSDLPTGSRWGFKEVHYFASDLDFLRRLFPSIRIVVLVRRPHAQISSYVRAPWRDLPPPGDPGRNEAIEHLAASAASDWTDKYRQLRNVAVAHPDSTMIVRHEDIGTDRLDLDALFAHCGVSTPPDGALRAVLAHRTLSSDDDASWSSTDRAHLDSVLANLTFADPHAEIVRFYYPETAQVTS